VAYRIDDLAATAEATPEEVAAVIAQLTGERRVLRDVAAAPGEPGGRRVEIFHDVLAAAVLDWQRRFGEVRKQATVRLAAVRRATRIAVPIVVALVVLAGIAGAGAYVAQGKRQEAEAKRAIAVAETAAVEHQRDQAKAELDEATGALASARSALELLKTSNAAPEAAVAQQAIQEIDQVLRPRVYFHGFTREQQSQAMDAASMVEKKTGFAVPGFQFVKEGPARTELRYFRPDDKKIVAATLAALEAAGVGSVEAKLVPGYERSKEIRPGHLEVWFGRPESAQSKY
jgi:hypothetical protein